MLAQELLAGTGHRNGANGFSLIYRIAIWAVERLDLDRGSITPAGSLRTPSRVDPTPEASPARGPDHEEIEVHPGAGHRDPARAGSTYTLTAELGRRHGISSATFHGATGSGFWWMKVSGHGNGHQRPAPEGDGEACQTQQTEHLRFNDLRGTAVTLLSAAGNAMPQICAATGHTLQSANRI